MRNRSKIAWKKLVDEKPDRKGTYLVAFFYDKKNESNVLVPVLAEWHTAGDIIELHNPARQKEDSSGVNGTVQKLLSRLGGSVLPYKVEEDGFYYIGVNWDFVEGDKGEDGCVEYVDNLGQDVFWADIPLMPDGYITDEEKEEMDKTEREDNNRKERDEKVESMIQRFESDKFLKMLFPLEETFPDGISANSQVETSRYGVLYRIPSIEYASLLCSARDVVTIVRTMIDKGQSFESISKMSIMERQKMFVEIVEASGVENIKIVKQAGHYFNTYRCRDEIFFAGCRNGIRDIIGGGKENMPKVLAKAKAESSRNFYLYRLERILQMQDVPEIIIASTFYEFAVAHTAVFMTDYVVGIADKKKYAQLFNVDPEGNYAEYTSDEDDEENKEYEFMTEEMEDGEEEEEKEPVIGVDYPYYAVAYSPNHLMYEANYSIRDNTTHKYVFGEDGKELLYNDWFEAKKKRDELEANRIA